MANPIPNSSVNLITTLDLQPEIYAAYLRGFLKGVQTSDFIQLEKFAEKKVLPSGVYGVTPTGNHATGNVYVSKTDNFVIKGWDDIGYYMNWGMTIDGYNDTDYQASGKLAYNFQDFEIPEGEDYLDANGHYNPYKFNKALTNKFYVNMPIVRFGSTYFIDTLSRILLADDDLVKINEQFGQQARKVQSQYIRATLINEATQHAPITVTGTGATATERQAIVDALKAIKTTLKRYEAKPLIGDVKASTGIGTQPVRGGYIAIINSELEDLIQSLDGFVHVTQYGSGTPVFAGEFGTIPETEIRFVVNNEIVRQSGTGNVAPLGVYDDWDVVNGRFNTYNMLIFGADAWAIATLSGSSRYTLKVTEFRDPMNVTYSMSWKVIMGVKVIRPSWIFNVPIQFNWV